MPRVWVPAGVNSAGDTITERAYVADEVAADDENGDLRYTQAAYDRAVELGVELDSITGSGKNGRITVTDVEAAAG